jgi:hypothetical protein
VWFQTRSGGAFFGMIGAVLFAVVGIALERWWQTPREEVASALTDMLAAVEANDLPTVLTCIAPTATSVTADATELMPQFRIRQANGGSEAEVTLDSETNPTTASVKFKPLIVVEHARSGMTGGYHDGVTMDFQRIGDRWLITGYSAKNEWRRGARDLSRGR